MWGYDVFPSTRTVDNFILKLRKRFERDPANPHPLPDRVGRGLPLHVGRGAMSARTSAHRHARLGAGPVAGESRRGPDPRPAGRAAVELVHIKTEGDVRTDIPLWAAGGRAFFTREIDRAQLANEVDIAVHSLKDLSTLIAEGLELAAVLEREDPRDALLTHQGASLRICPKARAWAPAVCAAAPSCCAPARICRCWSCAAMCPRASSGSQQGKYDAIVLATAGLKRLDLSAHIAALHRPCGHAPGGIAGRHRRVRARRR